MLQGAEAVKPVRTRRTRTRDHDRTGFTDLLLIPSGVGDGKDGRG